MRNMRQTTTLLGGAIALSLGLGAHAEDREITYNGDVAKIINENCVVCHREGGVGPMQLENYDQVRPWAPLISYRVESREMPPYAYDQHIGLQDLEGDWRLEQEEIDTIVAWVQQGAPMGDVDVVPRPQICRMPTDGLLSRCSASRT